MFLLFRITLHNNTDYLVLFYKQTVPNHFVYLVCHFRSGIIAKYFPHFKAAVSEGYNYEYPPPSVTAEKVLNHKRYLESNAFEPFKSSPGPLDTSVSMHLLFD